MSRRGTDIILFSALVSLLFIAMVSWWLMDGWQRDWFARIDHTPLPDSPSAKPQAMSIEDEVDGLLWQYDELIARPLFMSTRRPAQLDVSTADETDDARQQPLPGLDDLTLTSVVITPLEQHAWFRAEGTNETLRVSRGSTVRQWTLQTVEPSHVVLRAGSDERRLELRPRKEVAPAAPPAARAAPRRRRQ